MKNCVLLLMMMMTLRCTHAQLGIPGFPSLSYNISQMRVPGIPKQFFNTSLTQDPGFHSSYNISKNCSHPTSKNNFAFRENDKPIIFGARRYNDTLLFKTEIHKKMRFFDPIKEEISFPRAGQWLPIRAISQINVTKLEWATRRLKVDILEGGVGCPYAFIRVSSQQDDINVKLEIYGFKY